MEIKSIEQIKKDVAKECFFDSWGQLEELAKTKSSVTRKMNIVAKRYASQFQAPTETIVLKERIAELEDMLNEWVLQFHHGSDKWFTSELIEMSESLINKGKDNE